MEKFVFPNSKQALNLSANVLCACTDGTDGSGKAV